MKIKRLISAFLCALMIFSFAPDFCLVVKAAEEGEQTGGQSNIVNGSFEEPSNYRLEDLEQALGSQKGYKEKTPQGEIPGWNTTSTEGAIELGWLKGNGTSPHMVPTVKTEIISGIGASDGWQFAETIGGEASTIYQSLTLQADMSYNWTVHHRGRDGVDTLALFFVEDTGVNYVKSAKEGKDHFTQIIEWMKATPQSITAPAAGEMVQYTVYSTALGNNGTFTESDAGYFSFDYDAEHTVKFEVHLMSTAKTEWGEYSGSYVSESGGNELFALTCFKSASSSETSGNLVDNLSFSSVYDNINLLKNPGFDDAEVSYSSGYYSAKAANAPSPFSNIGWCSTASDYVVEIGTLKGGKDVYGLGVQFNTITYNTPSVRDGEQFAELNADQESSLYQIVETDPGKMYKWSLSHRGRDGLDTMALVIGPNQLYAPKKTSLIARDQLMQIVDWLYSQKDVVLDIPERGCSNEIKLYTPKFNENGGFVGNESTFSWYADETYTEEWSVWIISSDNSGWHDYGEIETGATYNYDYIVPQGQAESIFGFVSVKSAPKASDGKSDKTYGNFLDNIAFKEYYYVNAKFDGGENFGIVKVDPENEEHFISTDLDSNEVGWSLAGSKITISFQEQGRTFLGAYINGVFHSKDDTSFWTVTENEQGKKVYSFERIIDAAVTIKVVYQAKNVIYDTRNGYTYQYDLLNPNSGREVPMGINDVNLLPEYISHEPQFDDGWEFLGWRYIEIEGDNHTSHLVDAVHKVQCDDKTITDESTGDTITVTTLSIWEKDENGDYTVLVDDGIPIDEGITFFAEWKYRQRVIAQTFNKENSSYEISTEGGEVDVKIAFTEDANPSTPTDYEVGDETKVVVGKDIFAAADGTYINITAKNKEHYVFNGWYDESGNLVSRNPSYTYKVVDGGVSTYYARFELFGNDLAIKTTVDGEEDKYFAVDFVFSSLREDHLYAISGLETNPITVNDKVVTNPTILRADASGNAQITIYVKHGGRAVFEHLPENCVYSVSVKESSKDGYSVRGEVSEQTFGKAGLTIDLALKKSKQESWIAPGKHYQDIFAHVNSSGIIAITPESSFTLYVETAYAPSFYTNLSASLCFFNAQGEAQNFANGTRILMIDKCNAEKPRFYCFIVGNDSTSEIALTDFTALGSQDVKFALPSGEDITEKLLFAVDYVGTNNAPSGKLSLLYRNESVVTINPEYKAVATGADATSFTMTAQNANAASVGPFEVKFTVSESSPTVNTTYVGIGDAKYSVKLSLDGSTLPEGSYAEVNGDIFHSYNGYIIISPLSAGEITVRLYSRKPLVASSSEKVKIKAELLSAVSTVKSIFAGKSVTVEFTCVNAEEYAMDADIPDKVLTPGHISQTDITLKHEGIDKVLLTVSKKNNDGTYSEMLRNIDVSRPTDNNPVTVNLGSGFKAEAGETYIFSFVGYAGGVPVCRDDCCIVGGYE